MLELVARLPAGSTPTGIHGRLHLPFELRRKSRLNAELESGEAVVLALPRGQVLRGGDLLVDARGLVVEVIARDEQIVHAECDTPRQLAQVAYHLGNRHVPVQVGDGWLRFETDHVLEEMVRGLGARLTTLEAPFEPEAGAYASHHRDDNESGPRGRIHEFRDSLSALAEERGELR